MKKTLDLTAHVAAKSRILPARNAMLFWFGASLLVWAAMAMSAIWLI